MESEYSKGFKSGKTQAIEWFTIEEDVYDSSYKSLIKDNFRKAIHGCKDDYIAVRDYWLGYLQGFIKEGSKSNVI